MKKLSVLLSFVLLLCLAACGTASKPPPPPQTLVSEIAPSVSPETISARLEREIFGPANELYRCFYRLVLPTTTQDGIIIDGRPYWRAHENSPYQTMDELTSALRSHFAESIVQELLGLGIYTSHNGLLYVRHGGPNGSEIDNVFHSAFFGVESESEDKIVYRVTKQMGYENGVLTDEIVYYTRALQNGRWMFTNFEMLW